MTCRTALAVIAVGLWASASNAWAQDEGQALLGAHNARRDRHCVPAMTWSADIAAAARQWAEGCSMSHSQGSGYGENLAWGGGLTGAMAVDMWYNEASGYDYNAPGFSISTGHFTQVIWRGSTELGCGWADCNGQTFMVCRYAPPGNYEGEFPANVPQACK